MREKRERERDWVTGDLEMNTSFANPKGRGGGSCCVCVCMGYIERERRKE